MDTTHNHFCLIPAAYYKPYDQHTTTKVKLILSCMMEKVNLKSIQVIAKEAAFHSKTEINIESTNYIELLSKMKETVWSNWRFRSVFSLDLHTVKCEPLGGSSYIPLPAFQAAKKAIINLKNEDDERFKFANTWVSNTVEKHSERIDKKKRIIKGSQLGGTEISSQFEWYQ